jgi:HlyD family secretion protein
MMQQRCATSWQRWLRSLGAAALVVVSCAGLGAQEASRAAGNEAAKKWEATAPGRVEPTSGEIRLSPLAPGRIARVLVASNDKVFAGELLVRFDDEEARARLVEAQAQVLMRQRAREDETKKGPADRRRAGDAVAEGERLLADAQARLDQAVETAREAGRQPTEDGVVTAARSALATARDELRKRREALFAAEQTAGLPNFPESEVDIARANLSLARVALERTRVRAPIDGQVLQVNARLGEAAPALQQQPLVVIGDVSSLRVRAELAERDSGKIRIGQAVIVRATSFKDRAFTGKVAHIVQFVGPSRLNAPPSRGKLNDVNVVEVMVYLTDPGPLLVGMEVDVYFEPHDLGRSASK